MNKRFLSFFVLLISSIYVSFSADTSISCNWVPAASCTDSRDTMFYISSSTASHYDPAQPNEFLSAHVSLSSIKSYDTALCCTSPVNSASSTDRLNFYDAPTSDGTCPNGDQSLVYLTSNTNAIIGLNYSSFYSHVVCADLPSSYYYADIKVANTEYYKDRGYTCLFRIRDELNGRISSCNATYGFGANFYQNAVWARLYESVSSLKCNSDCTSKLDNRVYSSCSSKITACSAVPSACDGSLVGGWVEFGSVQDVNGNYRDQIKCEAPWTQTRINPEYVAPGETSTIEVDSLDGSCKNIISQEYPVLVENIPYKMKIYSCSIGE